MKEKKATIYTSPACPYCQQVKDWLSRQKIEFSEKDVSKDPKYSQELIKKSGQMGIPVTEIEDTIVVGFNEEKLKEALQQ